MVEIGWLSMVEIGWLSMVEILQFDKAFTQNPAAWPSFRWSDVSAFLNPTFIAIHAS